MSLRLSCLLHSSAAKLQRKNLRISLEAAYIDDGLDFDNADKFAKKEAISAMTKNCEHDKLKTILEALL